MNNSEDDKLDQLSDELLGYFRAMSEEDQAALARVATYLATHPEDGPKSMEEMQALCELAKRLQ